MVSRLLENSNWFLNINQKSAFEKWTRNTQDHSISTRMLRPLFRLLRNLIPNSVAPTVLCLAGVLCLVHAYYICTLYMGEYPAYTSIVAVFLAIVFLLLDGITPLHANHIRNNTPVVEFFYLCCVNVGATFLVITLCYILEVTDKNVQWHLVQIAQLMLIRKHLEGFRKGYLDFGPINVANEALFLYVVLGLLRATMGINWMNDLIDRACEYLPGMDLERIVLGTYYGLIVLTLVQALTLQLFASETAKSTDIRSTRNGLAFCLVYRLIPSLVILFANNSAPLTEWNIICDGVFMSVVTSDLILVKMSKRALHPWVVVFAMVAVFHHLAALFMAVLYYTAVFSEICYYMNVPMFSVVVNVYVSGVYDLCHLGHMKSFENAIKLGTRLFVGVCGDEDVTVYKRKPIMNEQEREATVASCKYVHEVIPHAPCFDLPVEFLLKHNIHVVALSPEYDVPGDKFYAGARELGIAQVIPRSPELSTSDLIRRVKEYHMSKEDYR